MRCSLSQVHVLYIIINFSHIDTVSVIIITSLISIVDVQNKQLIADKAYLEEQLKIRGTRRRVSEAQKDNSSQNVNQSQSCSSKGVKDEVKDEEKSSKETTDDKLNSSESVKSSVVKKEINILDDLEKEFNKQRQQEQRELGSWHPWLAKETERGRRSGSGGGRQSANTSLTKCDAEVSEIHVQYMLMNGRMC